MALVAILAAGTVAYAVTRPTPVKHAGATPDAGPGIVLPTFRALKPLAGNRVLIVGDSWTQGYGSSNPNKLGYVPLLKKHYKWDVFADPLSGSGYVRPPLTGDQTQTYVTGLQRVKPPWTPDLVIVQGGQNDRDQTITAIKRNFGAAVAIARERWPSAQLLVVGPMVVTADFYAKVSVVNGTMRLAASADHVAYMNAWDQQWLPQALWPKYINKNAQGHPNDAGYARIAIEFEHDFSILVAGKVPSIT